ncbi:MULTISPECIES: ArnT family glycosyltransferase [unclassified Frankia]|uniref:ArnT family glycosyltransferase n=1 Tax=unclassified Frankia TaxID=2632575 RepID=UPI002AD331D8|nr:MULTISPECIES: glycosyltransferase family 39 protein [unclassified Frankia]
MARLLLPFLVVIQVILSIKLINGNTAFLDEATYLYAGHEQVQGLIHGRATASYATYFSGAPIVYPILAALVEKVGGLVGVRALSLIFMAGATCCLFGVSRRLFDRTSAFFSGALFVALGPTQFLGVLATYDAMALFLLSLSVWLVIRARDSSKGPRWLVLSGVALGLANVTKYASGIFDPVIIVLVMLAFLPELGRKRATFAAVGTACVVATTLIPLIVLGGSNVMMGISSTTTERASGQDSASIILSQSWRWVGAVAVTAALGLVFRTLDRRRVAPWTVCLLLTVVIVLVPANQARIHTTTSLMKHADFGAWFACSVAGYAVASTGRWISSRWFSAGVYLVAAGMIVALFRLGNEQATSSFHSWPNSTRLVAALGPLTRDRDAMYLVEDSSVPQYYLKSQVNWRTWRDTYYFSYDDWASGTTLVGIPAYQAAIRDHLFKVIVIGFGSTYEVDHAIALSVEKSPDYRLFARIDGVSAAGPYSYFVWQYKPGTDH